MNKITFTGGGCNSSSILSAIANAMNAPSKATLPAGASWPFVTLTLDGKRAEFNMVHIKKSVMPSTVTEISLSKLGYIFFRTHDQTNDFGFVTLKVGQVIKELSNRGYNLSESCERNLLAAKLSLFSIIALTVVVVLVVTVLAVLKPNGI